MLKLTFTTLGDEWITIYVKDPEIISISNHQEEEGTTLRISRLDNEDLIFTVNNSQNELIAQIEKQLK